MTDRDHGERRAFRAGRVRLAFLTSAGSKALGLLVQFLAVPLAVRSLGAERFGIYTMLVSALVWIDLGRLGIGPGLTRELALAWNRGQQRREQMLFSNAIFFLVAVAGLMTILLLAGYKLGENHLSLVFGSSAGRFGSEITAGIMVVAGFLVCQVIFSAAEAARSAYQADYINNLMNTLANLVSLALIFAVALYWPTVPAFALAVFGSLALSKGVNLVLLFFGARRYLVPRWRFVDRSALRPLLASSLAFWLVQIATLMMHNLSLVQLGQITGAARLAPFAVVFRLLQLLSTAVLMISMPLWPAITDATVRGDGEWIRNAYRRLLIGAMTFCIVVAIVLGMFGPRLIPLWAGPDVRPGYALTALLGFYFVIWMWNHCHSAVLFGLGKLWGVAYVVLAEGIAVLVLSAWLAPRYGAEGTAFALCMAGLGITAWLLPMLVRTSLAKALPVLPDELPNAAQARLALSEEPIA
ncbi:MAG: hypothetical protein EOP94_02605 [Zymomonas sp.]|nr:MAG: hypothetical protein EOP94_02605 [Zymomonas sp.]